MTNSTTRDEFEAWWAHEIDQNGGYDPGADYRHWALVAYLGARRAALLAAVEVCEAEHLEDPQTNPDDDAYDMAVSDCIDAIRALANEVPQ